jgi:hypothetical protein
LHKEHAGIRVKTQIEIELVPKEPVQTGASSVERSSGTAR